MGIALKDLGGVRSKYPKVPRTTRRNGLGAAVRRALLLSGGHDSAAIAWWKRPEAAIFVDYGQRAAVAERRSAEAIAAACGAEFIPVSIDSAFASAATIVHPSRTFIRRCPATVKTRLLATSSEDCRVRKDA